jgi:hypothetical protein
MEIEGQVSQALEVLERIDAADVARTEIERQGWSGP